MSIIAAKDTLRVEDDLENNLAFNEPRIYTPTENIKNYSISGDESVRLGKEYIYTVEPNLEGMSFTVDDTDIAEVVSIQNNTCKVVIKARDEIFKLSAIDKDNNILSSKIIYTTK